MAKYLTKQRKILQDYLENRIDQELSVKKVAEDLSELGVSLSAIYRNLAELEKEKLVIYCHKEGSRELYFRYLCQVHCFECFHISCQKCRGVVHISVEQSKKMEKDFRENYGFHLDFLNTVFYGVCDKCLEAEK